MDKIIAENIWGVIGKTKSGTSDSDRHLMPIFSIALASKGKIIVELGVREGISTLPLLLATSLNGGILYSVDIQDSLFVCPPELAKNWKFIKSDALKFLNEWDKSKKMDIVFVDDLHTYPHVKKELEIISEYVTPESVILLHDLMYRTAPKYHTDPGLNTSEWAYGGPYRAVNELSNSKWEWSTLPWNNGLTILRKKGGVISESRIRVIGERLIRKYAPKYREKARNLYKIIKSWF